MELPTVGIVVAALSLWCFGVFNYIALSRRPVYNGARKWAILGMLTLLGFWSNHAPSVPSGLIEALRNTFAVFNPPSGPDVTVEQMPAEDLEIIVEKLEIMCRDNLEGHPPWNKYAAVDSVVQDHFWR